MDTNAREIEADLRKVALSQAAHDHRGNASAMTVVEDAETYFAFLAKAFGSKAPAPSAPASDDQVNRMVNRFLSWRLPPDFSPDGGISFKATFNEHTAHPMRHEPVGTNLLNAEQARAMVQYMLAGDAA